jgi:hypothetical protein
LFKHVGVRVVVPFAVVLFLLASALVAFSATSLQPIRLVAAHMVYDSKGQLVGPATPGGSAALVTVKVGKDLIVLSVNRDGITGSVAGGLLWESPNCAGNAFQLDYRVPEDIYGNMTQAGSFLYAYSGPRRAITPASMRLNINLVLGPCQPYDVNIWTQYSSDPATNPMAPVEAVADLNQFTPPFSLRSVP